MSHRLTLWIIFCLSAVFLPVWIPAQGLCYRTPHDAVESLASTGVAPMAQGSGYRVISLRSDMALGQTWATIVSCVHPEWPAIASQVQQGSDLSWRQTQTMQLSTGTLIVRAGQVVTLWKQEDALRIEVAAVAEESAALNSPVRIRILNSDISSSSGSESRTGIVRGPASVEMMR